MKCICGHAQQIHDSEVWRCRVPGCECCTFQPEEEVLESTRLHDARVERERRRAKEAEERAAEQKRYAEQQEHLRRRDLFERIAIKLLPAFVGDASSDFWIEAIRARFTDLLKAEEEGL